MYKKVLLAYDGSIEGRRALREGARIAQFCNAEVFLLAVVELSAGTGTLEGGLAFPVTEQVEIFKNILAEGVERLKAMGFSPTARLGMGGAGREIAGVAEEIGANLVVIGHRPDGPLARWPDGCSARSGHTWSRIFAAATFGARRLRANGQTDGWPAHLASDTGTACQRSTRLSRLRGGPLTMWLHRAERRCTGWRGYTITSIEPVFRSRACRIMSSPYDQNQIGAHAGK